ncbi:fumarylacetoacetate hydrolase family protein [Dethiobacter alkaliphilus]|uniref:5-carboxymethyl-2-hydroxymuconate Delta-isomerase n=1 Tax=Dethiobacter alkaliphilus AHT 1 TaxID=555088 RepID=C0GCT0_DETAL|nr:fumarylacetoacetate hydrolase family protein [Dethiobacter alkaliphilus]EEG79015.1 5-carboxymethyl-2-hydroxymuconate Delta-isomerase [Dethiobacter alkaliphilus AHT 1]
MKWARFSFQGKECTGFLRENILHVIKGDYFKGNWQETGETVALDEAKLYAPCRPSKIICVGLNYRDHAAEMKMELPAEPIMFMKPPSAVIGPGEAIVLPHWIGRTDYEAELAVVMGKTAKNVSAQQAGDYIFGYTCGNDVTGRRLQKTDGQWTRAKSFDTFCPLGPWIATEIDAADLEISLELNGEIRQQSSTAQLVFGPHKLIELISRVMTLEPGDVIMTGTPSGVGPLTEGDRVTVNIDQIGALSNSVTG